MAALIAHIVYSFHVGGLENGIVNLINRLPAENYRHAIISLTDIDPVFFSRIRRPDVEPIAIHKTPGPGVKTFPRVYELLKQLKPDILHTRNLAALEMSVPGWAAGVPARVHGEHGRDVDDPHGTNRKQQWTRRVYKPFVTHYIALSRELDTYLAEKIHVSDSRRSLICNGVDATRFVPTGTGRAQVRGSPFNDPSLYVFGAVGRLQAIKNHAGLIRAFARMRRDLSDAAQRTRLVIVGDGPLRAELARIVQEEGVERFVWMAGERADIPEQMKGMDCFVLPSLAEGISNTILEAMSCGLPVIATAVGGSPDLVESGVSGTVVPSDDAGRMAQAMATYVFDQTLAVRQGIAARQRIQAQFSLDGMMQRYDAVYQSLLKGEPLMTDA